MRKFAVKIVVSAMTVGFAAAGAAPPAMGATSPGVTIGVIRTLTAPYHGRVVVKPRVTARGQAAISYSTMTVKRGSKTVATRARAPRLSAGTYSVTTKTYYRPYTLVKTAKTVTQRIVAVPAWTTSSMGCRVDWVEPGMPGIYVVDFRASCSSSAFDGAYVASGLLYRELDANAEWGGWSGSLSEGTAAVTVDLPDPTMLIGRTFSDVIYATADLYKTVSRSVVTTTRKYGAQKSTSRRQKLIVRAGAKQRTCATYADFKRVRFDFSHPETYGSSMASVRTTLHSTGTRSTYADYGDSVIEFRHYRPCTKGATVSVGFFNGYAYAKSYYS